MKNRYKYSWLPVARPSLVALSFAVFLTGCGPDKNDVVLQKSVEKYDGPALEHVESWTGDQQAAGANCGLLTVPSDYSAQNPVARKIAFVTLPAIKTGDQPEQNPMIFFVGGPGMSGTLVTDFNEGGSGASLRHNRELIMVDYRGVGLSEPFLECQGPGDMKNCKKALHKTGMADELRTANFVKDIDLLLEKFGHDKVSVYSGSYGTRVALTMMRDRPERLSHVIIDGVFPPEVNGFSQGARAILAGLNKIAERCEESIECTRKLGSTRSKIEGLADKWKARDDHEELFNVLASYSHQPAAPLLVNELSMLNADKSAELLYKTWYGEPEDNGVEAQESENNNTEAPQTSENEMPDVSMYEFSMPMALGIVCSEEAAFISQQPLNKNRHNFSGTLLDMVNNYSSGAPFPPSAANGICKKMEILPADAVEIAPITSSIPTLVLSGGGDTQTSFEWGELAASRLPNARHYIFPFSGHMVAMENPCAVNIAGQFADNPMDKLDISCLKKQEKWSNDLILSSDNIVKEFKFD